MLKSDQAFRDIRYRAIVLASALSLFVYFGGHAAGAFHGTFGFEPSSVLLLLGVVVPVALRTTTPVFLISIFIAMQIPFFFDRPLADPISPSDAGAWYAAIIFFLIARFHSWFFLSGKNRLRYVDFLREESLFSGVRRSSIGRSGFASRSSNAAYTDDMLDTSPVVAGLSAGGALYLASDRDSSSELIDDGSDGYFGVNPATGAPMVDGFCSVDALGNAYGCDMDASGINDPFADSHGFSN